MPTVQILVERCKGCERCNNACPQGILGMDTHRNRKGYNYAMLKDVHRCIGCCRCAISCPDTAIEVSVDGTQYRFFDY